MNDHQPPVWHEGAVTARCPSCGGVRSRFAPHGNAVIMRRVNIGATEHEFNYFLMECLGCGRGGFAVRSQIGIEPWTLDEFFPTSPDFAELPAGIPDELGLEVREAERAAGAEAFRAASTTLRSALEKTLKVNGYTKGNLYEKIVQAAEDGVITKARQAKAHQNVRSLGNDIVHDEWRPVDAAEYGDARQYVIWILRDLYDDRETVVEQLQKAGRLLPDSPAEASA